MGSVGEVNQEEKRQDPDDSGYLDISVMCAAWRGLGTYNSLHDENPAPPSNALDAIHLH